MSLLLNRNALSDTVMHFEGDESFVIENRANPWAEKAVLDRNAQLRGESPNKKAHLKPVASIPTELYFAWKREWKRGGYAKDYSWEVFSNMKIRNRDFSYLRTSNIKV